MNEYHDNKIAQEAVNCWLGNHFQNTREKAVFFTLKFHQKRGLIQRGSIGSIDKDYAEKLLSSYLNRLDRAYFCKSATKKGIRLKRIVFKHLGFSGENTHFHGVVFCNGDPEEFLSKCAEIWGNLHSNNWIDVTRSQFEIAASIPKATLYAAHEVSKIGLDSWMLKYTNIPDECGHVELAEQVRDLQNRTLTLREERLMH